MPDSLDGYISLVSSYNSDSEKRRVINTVLQKFPAKSQAHVMHGDYLSRRSFRAEDSYIHKENLANAAHAYDKALELDSRNWDAYYGARLSDKIMFEQNVRKIFLNS